MIRILLPLLRLDPPPQALSLVVSPVAPLPGRGPGA